MLETTIKVRYQANQDDAVMARVRRFAKELEQLGIEVKGEAVQTRGVQPPVE